MRIAPQGFCSTENVKLENTCAHVPIKGVRAAKQTGFRLPFRPDPHCREDPNLQCWQGELFRG